MKLGVALRLARVSNLPTVWTNVAVGAILAGCGYDVRALMATMVALSLFYSAGMFLNDAYDSEFDAKFRPDRPIPAGEASAAEVFASGYAMFGAGLLLLVWMGAGGGTSLRWHAALTAILLAGAIVVYDRWHKNNPLSPLVMGVCRMLVYFASALAACPALSPSVIAAGAVSVCYLVGLTYSAKQEHLAEPGGRWPLLFLAVPILYGAWWGGLQGSLFCAAFAVWVGLSLRLLLRRRPGDVGRGVVRLIAGISLLDAVFLAGVGAWGAVAFAVVAFAATLACQRWVSGT